MDTKKINPFILGGPHSGFRSDYGLFLLNSFWDRRLRGRSRSSVKTQPCGQRQFGIQVANLKIEYPLIFQERCYFSRRSKSLPCDRINHYSDIMNSFKIIIISFSLLGIFASASFAIADKDGPKIGEIPPPLAVTKMIQGSPAAEISWDKFKGKVVVLEFWATWCGPCVQSIPHLNDLVEQFKDKPVVFISVTSESEDVVQLFLKSHSMKAWLGLDDYEVLNKAFHVRNSRCR